MFLVLTFFSMVFAQPDPKIFEKFPSGAKMDKRFNNMKKKEEKMTFFLYSNQTDDPLNQDFLDVGKIEKLSKIKFKLIDCIENKFYCEDLGISSFPSASFKIEDQIFNFTWDFQKKDFEEFAGKISAEPVMTVYDSESLNQLTGHPVAFMLYYNPEVLKILDTSYIDQFKTIARQYKNSHVYFGICQTGKVSYLNDIGRRDLPILLQLGADEAYKYNISKALTKENMQSFIENHKCLMKIRITRSNWQETLDCFKGKIVGISFLSNESSAKLNTGHLNFLIRDLRMENDWRFQFASVNLTTFDEPGKVFNVQAPSFALIDFREEPQVRVIQDVDLKNHEKMKKLLELAWNGENLNDFGIQPFQVTEEAKTLKNPEKVQENPRKPQPKPEKSQENPEKPKEKLRKIKEKPEKIQNRRIKTEDL
jgi:hypothetical protein